MSKNNEVPESERISENDTVIILSEPSNSIDREARVQSVLPNGVIVSNMNMPFCGTLCNEFFLFSQVRLVRRKIGVAMGTYDTVSFRCPNCAELNFYQSKIGDCAMHGYTVSDAPLLVIADMHDEAVKDRLYCEHCGNKLHVRVRFSVTITCDSANDDSFREV